MHHSRGSPTCRHLRLRNSPLRRESSPPCRRLRMLGNRSSSHVSPTATATSTLRNAIAPPSARHVHPNVTARQGHQSRQPASRLRLLGYPIAHPSLADLHGACDARATPCAQTRPGGRNPPPIRSSEGSRQKAHPFPAPTSMPAPRPCRRARRPWRASSRCGACSPRNALPSSDQSRRIAVLQRIAACDKRRTRDGRGVDELITQKINGKQRMNALERAPAALKQH